LEEVLHLRKGCVEGHEIDRSVEDDGAIALQPGMSAELA